MSEHAPVTAGNRTVHKHIILITVILGTFLGRLDQTIVNLALPKIINDFSITVTSAGWISTAYILANAIFVPVWGKLGDSIGRKKVYVTGFVMFIVGSMLAGFAWNLSSLIFFRVIQAIAGSADYPTAMAILTVTYTDNRERAQALGIWSASFAVAAVFGPLIGGPLIDHFNWRSVFLVNIPVGLVGLAMAMAYIKESKAVKQAASFDFLGAIVLGISLSSLVLVLDKGLEWGWLSMNSVITYIVSAVSLYWFVHIERNHPEPVVDLKFFKNPIFMQALTNNFIIFMGLMGSIFLVPIFAQTFLGYTATQSGYLFMPMAFALMIGAPIGGRLTGKVQPRTIIAISTFVSAIGIWLFIFLDARSTLFDLAFPMAVMAFGMGFGMADRTNIIAVSVPTHEVGVASSVLALARNIAGAFGIAIFATLLNSSIENNVLKISKFSTFHGTTATQYQQFVSLIMLKAQINGYHTVYEWAGILILFGAILVLTMKNIDLHVKRAAVHVEA